MQIHLHPTRHEALTASETALTRWSLDTNPATILAQMPTAPESVFYHVYSPGGQLLTFGGVTGSPDGRLFAHQRFRPHPLRSLDPDVLEWRSFDDFSLVRTREVPGKRSGSPSLACSPDGRWLVLGQPGYIFLLDWQTGTESSRHFDGGDDTNGLAFDPTATFVAGLATDQSGGCLRLWRLDPAERFVLRPVRYDWWPEAPPQDVVCGPMALTLVHEQLDRTGIDGEWDLLGTECLTAFSPDGRLVVFCLTGTSSWEKELVAYEVHSGKRRWCVRSAAERAGPCLFTPDGRALLVPVQGGNVEVYRAEDGALEQRWSCGLDKPTHALAFDHDGQTLWLATEDALTHYQPRG